MTIDRLRTDYQLGTLSETDVNPDPVKQFDSWLQVAIDAELPEPHAMTLATSTVEGRPSARIVLLRGYDERGFLFFTNYRSRKGRELLNNPHASLVLFWSPLERQVRIDGTVEKVSAAESDTYFQSRPIKSRLGAIASDQSEVIADREVLEDRLREATEKYDQDNVPRPEHWGGFRIMPTAIEFWQGRRSRLHDRLLYTKTENDWQISRLSP